MSAARRAPGAFQVTRKHEARFRALVIRSRLGQRFLRAVDETAQEPDGAAQREAATRCLVESYHAALVDLGIPNGFHNNYMHLAQHDTATGCKPPLTCGVCARRIEAARDFACNRRAPRCYRCAVG